MQANPDKLPPGEGPPATPAGHPRRLTRESLKLPLALGLLTLLLVGGDWLWRWDQLLYDVHLRYWTTPPPDDVVIVAVDETSLRDLGRWPWPRRTHAQLIDRLSAAGVRAIGLDVIFAEPDRGDPEGDRALARAIAANGRTVLPVMVEQPRLGGQMIETLPLPRLAAAAAALGHVHVELDPDGIARRTYLFEGLGEARWPHFGLALLRLTEAEEVVAPPPPSASCSPYVWRRADPILIPYIGPPGHFPRISYSQVLKGEFVADSLRDKIVLVGVTATGLGDFLPTPVSGLTHPMPGVEVNAHILTALRQDHLVEAMGMPLRLLLSLLIALLPALLLPLLRPRAALLTSATLILATLLLCLVLLRGWLIWFPPTAVILALALSYPLWSWRRLEDTLGYLDRELSRLRSEPSLQPHDRPPDPDQAMAFIQSFAPVQGWVLYDHQGRKQRAWGQLPTALPPGAPADRWQDSEDSLWTGIPTPLGLWQLGVHGAPDQTLAPPQARLVLDLVGQLISTPQRPPESTVELIQNRVQEVQHATARLSAMRRFIDDSLAQMADGVLVVNSLGEVLLFNHQAARYLRADDGADLMGLPLLDLLAELQIQDSAASWEDAIAAVLLEQSGTQSQARNPQGRDLLLQMTPLSGTPPFLRGLIVNISDITPLKESERKRTEMLSFLSHDLRAPLVSLLSYMELVRAGVRSDDPEALMQQAQHYANKTLSLAESFVQLSRAENLTELSLQPVNLADLAADALDHIWPQANTKQIQLEPQLGRQPAWVLGDRSQLERTLMNLLSNAIKYSPAGSRVSVQIETDAEQVHCCVSDTGYGIPAAELSNVFQRFTRIDRKEHRQEAGSGLGLAFVQTVINSHGGRIDVSSELGQGTRICFHLPHAAADEAEPT